MAVPFSEGFLDTIVGVQWRSGPPPIPKFSWFGIEQVGAINAFVTTSFTISIAGVGSFQPFSGTQNAGGWAGYLHTPLAGSISGGEINGALAPSGGVTSINGFGRADNSPFNTPHTVLLFKLDDKLPKKSFKVTVTNNISAAIGDAVMTIKAVVMKEIKEGEFIFPNVVSQVNVFKKGMNHVPSIFTIDPKKLKVTGG